jgi:dTDP-glucose 4,6-dehydratase
MFPEKLIPLAITNVLEGKKIPIYKPGNQIREWLYVEDHCRAIDAILKDGKAGETYFVSPDNPELSNLEVVKKVLQILGKDESWIEYVSDRPGHDQKYAMDNSKIKKKLGWKPLYGLDKTLELTVKWYQDNSDWWKKVKTGEYQKYYEKQYANR